MNIQPNVDHHKLMFHPQRVAQWLDGGDCYPLYVEIGPTNRCNHRCIFCALDWMKHGGSDIDADVLTAALEDMGRCGVKSLMFAGEGEPLLHPDICRLVAHAKTNGMDVAITTNGAIFDDEKARKCLPYLSWIRISLDAGTPETYALIHGVKKEGEFQAVLENIRNAVKIRESLGLKVTIGVQSIIIPQNIDEIIEIGKKVKEVGADNFQVKPYSHHPLSKNDLSVDHSRLEGVERELRTLNDRNFGVHFRKNTIERITEGRNYRECYGLPFFALIDSRGDIIPCNLFYHDPEFTYGNLNEQSFSRIWQGEKRKDVLRKIRDRGIETCRLGCRLDAVNRYLFELKCPHPHVNFI
jgi:GTP 3',8-cyclase